MGEIHEGRRRRVSALAASQDQVVSRAQLYALGYSRAEVRWQVRAERWQALGRHCLVLHTGPLTIAARYWVAVLEGGPRALIDGESALLLAGLRHYTPERIRVSVPRGAKIRHRGTGVDIRQTRRWQADDVVVGGVPRTRPAVAAVRAALWARSNRQAELLMTMAVQQGLVRPEDLAAEMLRVRRDKRRLLLNQVVLELMGGIRSLGELDVVRGCRLRGLPEPDKQVCRRTSGGIYYLDFRWSRWRVVVEVDGIQHAWAANLVGDALRHNRLAIDGDTVLRLPVLGLRAQPDEFFAQIGQALAAAGWQRTRAPAA
jgi:very-short-patch-repair endonuclease